MAAIQNITNRCGQCFCSADRPLTICKCNLPSVEIITCFCGRFDFNVWRYTYTVKAFSKGGAVSAYGLVAGEGAFPGMGYVLFVVEVLTLRIAKLRSLNYYSFSCLRICRT